MKIIDPATGNLLRDYTPHSETQIARLIERAQDAFLGWRKTSFSERAQHMHKAAKILRQHTSELAALMADEMGKVLKDGEAEIEKCALCCDHYAEVSADLLADEIIAMEQRSLVSYQPLGVVLAIMPWNFPFWQVFRFAAPNLMAGNVGLLKHASNVSGCALEIERIFAEAGFPPGCFTTLLVPSDKVEPLIEHPHIRAVTLTGSNAAGKAVAAKAGAMLKKTVLELGGSDAYVVLGDADVKKAAVLCAKSRLINAGQSCIAAKRFIVDAQILDEFTEHFIAHFKTIVTGHPKDEKSDIGPLARKDLRDTLAGQVEHSVSQGAKIAFQGKIPGGLGAYFPPTVLTHVQPGMIAFDEELFGPVAAIVEASGEEEAFRLANASPFGLGGAIFTHDAKRGEQLAKTMLDSGQVFVNDFVRSDPKLPFGGVKQSGYGRELGKWGIREFVNIKTISVAN